MTDDITLPRAELQAALDAIDEYYATTPEGKALIETLRARLAQPNDFNPDWDAMAVMVEEQQRMAKRIEELKERLLQVELKPTDKTGSPCAEFWDWLPKAYRDGDKGDEPKFTKYNMEVAYLAGKQSLAQGKQEPVAMKFQIYKQTPPRGRELEPINSALLPWVYDQDPSSGNTASMWVTPVATLPPKREWVGLTDEEIKAIRVACGEPLALHIEFARAIEAKLKEKNHD